METITHRELRDNSAAVLRRVEAGESILVTNRGRPAALIGPPPDDVLAPLEARGELRRASRPPADLGLIRRKPSQTSTAEVLDDVRGRW